MNAADAATAAGADVAWLRTLYAECLRRAGESTCSLPEEIDRGAVRLIAEALAGADRGEWDSTCAGWRPQIVEVLTHVDGIDAATAARRAATVVVIAPNEAQEILDERAAHAQDVRAEAERLRAAAAEAESDDLPRRRAALVCVGDVKPETIEWVWGTRLARGKMTLFAGDPGAGKTYVALAVTAALTRGGPLPGEAAGRDPVSVVYMTREDGIADTLRPRLDALGADVSRVHVLLGADDGSAIGLADLDVIAEAVDRTGAGLLVVDPIQSWLGARVDAHRANETRPILDGLGTMSARCRCATLLIADTAKARGTRAVAAALGSIDFAGACRVMLIAGADPHDRTRSVLAAAKSNIGPMPASLAYVVDRAVGGIAWKGVTDLTAGDVLAADAATDEDRSALTEAVDWLRETLKGRPRPAKEMHALARGAGIADRTLDRARRAAGVRASRHGGFGRDGEWIWELVATPADVDSAAAYETGAV